MKQPLLFVLFLLLLINSKAQETFSYTLDQYYGPEFFEMSDNRYAFISQDSILILSNQGEVLEKRFFSESTNSRLLDFYQTDAGTIYSTGIYDEVWGSHFFLSFIEYDNELHPILKKKYRIETPDRQIVRGIKSTMTSEENFVFIASIADTNWENDSLYSYKIYPANDSIWKGPAQENEWSIGRIEQMNDSTFYFAGEKLMDNYSEIVVLDSSLAVCDSILPGECANAEYIYVNSSCDLKKISEEKLLFSSDVRTQDYSPAGIGIAKIDTTRTILAEAAFKKGDQSEYSMYSSIDFIDTANIFIGGRVLTELNQFSFPYQGIIANCDNNLNVKWEKFYQTHELASERLLSINATADGGLIAITQVNDFNSGSQTPNSLSQIQNQQTHDSQLGEIIIIFKLDSLGNSPYEATSSGNTLIKTSELFLYPNPGTNQIEIRTAVQSLGGIFRLHSINGKQVQQHKITRSITELNTQNLPQGTYIFEYTLNHEILESGKWILRR
ncbi:MAG: T9SS type A sorting domain-containing protein [Bacteroidota bacterium]|nr:T9SS type A sorting domain-containing protein [Bacteroidota bacterium]